METIKCPACGAEISSSEAVCPRCGKAVSAAVVSATSAGGPVVPAEPGRAVADVVLARVVGVLIGVAIGVVACWIYHTSAHQSHVAFGAYLQWIGSTRFWNTGKPLESATDPRVTLILICLGGAALGFLVGPVLAPRGTAGPVVAGPGPRPISGMAAIGLALGILSLLTLCVSWASIGCALIGLILSAISRGAIRRGVVAGAALAKGGIACSLIALVLDAVIIGSLATFLHNSIAH